MEKNQYVKLPESIDSSSLRVAETIMTAVQFGFVLGLLVGIICCSRK